MSESSIQLDIGIGGRLTATWLDGTGRDHQEVIIQTQASGADPVNVGASNPLPTTVSGTVAISGTVPISAASTLAVIATPSSKYKLISANTTNATNVKGAAGLLTGLYIGSLSTAPRYVKLYDKATAPTVGTDVPVHTFLIPGGTTGAGSNIPIPDGGLIFSSGISFAITGGIADTDTTIINANEVVVNLNYI